MNTPHAGSMPVAWRLLWLILGILLVGGVGVVGTSVAMMSTKLLVVVLAATLLGIAFALCGNARLFVFYAMFFLAPWTIKKDFLYYGHMSGAVSFDLHISDPFLLAMIAFQIGDWARGRSRPFRFPKSLLLWMMLMALGLISVVFNPLPLPPAHEVYRMTRLLLWMLVLTNELVRRQQFKHAAYALLLAAAGQASLAYLQVLGIDLGLQSYGQMTKQGMENLGASTLAGERGVVRIAGIMTHPNALGAYLALSSAVAMGLLFAPLKALLKTLVAILWASFAVVIVLTLSRGAWVDFVIVLLGVTLLTHTNRHARGRYFLLRAAILGGILLIGVAFSGMIITRITHSTPEGISARWDFVEVSRKMILERPILGFGLNTFAFYQPPYTKQGSVNGMIDAYGEPESWPVVHNSYLLIWVEQGTVGLIIWLWFHVAIIRLGISNLRLRDPTLHALNVAFLIAFLAIMVDSLVSFFDRLQQGILIWTFAGLIFALDYWRRENETNGSRLHASRPSSPSRWSAVTAPGLIRRPLAPGWLPGLSHLDPGSQSSAPIHEESLRDKRWIVIRSRTPPVRRTG